MWEKLLRNLYFPFREGEQLRHFALLQEGQWDSPDRIRARQLEDLKSIVLYAFERVPYYRQSWKRLGRHPSEIRSFGDFERWPILHKSVVRREADSLGVPGINKLHLKRTSGSTGQPLDVSIDADAMGFKHAVARRANEWSGWRRGQPVAQLWGRPEHSKQGFKGRLRNRLIDRAIHLNTLEMSPERMADFLRRWNHHAPALLFGHAHSLCLLAQFARRKKFVPRPAIGIISSAMPLPDWQRKLIAEVFQHRVTDRYGCEETSLVAGECERGGMHIAAESVYVEVVDGRVLLTDLVNRAMPLIRYEIGDRAELSEAICPCGRGLPMMKRIVGREADFIATPDGRWLSGISLTENLILKLPGVDQVQIVQEELTRIRLNVVPANGNRLGPLPDAIRSLSRELFGRAVRIEIEFLAQIPLESSGKVRYCISRVARPFAESGAA